MQYRKIYPYNPKLKELARQLRNHSTFSEVLLWNQLKNKRIMGYDFHRQKPILNYILDFFCHELELAIEIDGCSHDFEEAYKKDKSRQEEIERLGIVFLRFDDLQVKKNMAGVLQTIEGWIKEHTPNPSQEGNNENEIQT
ncbi:MAG: DNA methylase [Deltaproteobacteria bacterium GWC2_42_11]|nr:MAG: DNA methylase [Deltaproteobacteria bacterium GWC2_42_11]HBO84976.1 DNA methylase [Deltaproteobacteria bacterium]